MLARMLVLIVGLGVAMSVPSFGGELPGLPQPALKSRALDVAQAERLALRHAFSVKIARREIAVAAGRRSEALGEILPELIGDSNVNRAKNGRNSYRNNRATSFVLRQPLYRGGRVRARLRGAELERQRAHETIRDAEQALRLRARVAYWGVVLAEKLVAVSRQQVDLAEEQLSTAKARVARQLASILAVNRAEVELANQDTAWQLDKNTLAIRLSIFRVLLGLPAAAAIALTDDFPVQKKFAAIQAADVDEAMRQRPNVRSARLAHAIQEQEVRAVRSTLLPSVDFESRVGGSEVSGGSWEQDWQVGLSIRLPIFDGLRNRGRLKVQRARQAQDALFVKELEDQVRVEVRTAWHDLKTAQTLAIALTQSTQKALVYLNNERERQKKGAGTYLNVLDARRSLAQTQRNHYQALHDFLVARCRLERASGVLGE